MRQGRGFSDDVYSSVRSFALKGTLLPASTLRDMADSKGLDEMVTRLRGTVYNASVLRAQRPYTANKLEMAFREHLASVHRSLIDITPGRELLSAYYMKYVAGNLRTVMKGKALGREFEELLKHIDLYAEELIGRRDIVVRALTSKGLEDAANLLKDSEFGDEAGAAVRAFKDTGKVQVFDIYIDSAFYKNIVGAFEGLRRARVVGYPADVTMVRPLVAVDVDSYNTLTVLRGKAWGLSPSEVRSLMVEPTFDIPRVMLASMVASESSLEAVRYLQGTAYQALIPEATSEDELISKLEEAFLMLGYRRALRPFLWDVFGLSVALGLVKLKELEARNLAAIAFGVEQALGSKGILGKLVLLR